jgi:hypothetical protein
VHNKSHGCIMKDAECSEWNALQHS